MRFKYILLDFDGTIGDTNELVIQCLKITVSEYLSIVPRNEDLIPIMGKLLVDQLSYFCKLYNGDIDLVPLMREYYRDYYKLHQNEIKPFPGVKETLIGLKKMDVSTAVVSSKGINGILHGLRAFEIEEYIDVIVSAYDVTHAKPHPESIQKALQQLGGNTESALMVGDSPWDIESGINAGTKTALVKYTLFPSEHFKDMKIDYYLDEFSQLIEIV